MANPLPEAVAICRHRSWYRRGSSEARELPDLKRIVPRTGQSCRPKWQSTIGKSTRGHVAGFRQQINNYFRIIGERGRRNATPPAQRNECCNPEPPPMAAGYGCCAGLWLGRSGAPPKKDRVDIAMDRGRALSRKCKRSTGPQRSKARESARNGYAMTALGLLSLVPLATSHRILENWSLHGAGVGFILRNDPRRGEYEYFGSDGSRMYGHGITTLCLTEMMGMAVYQEARIRSVAQKSITLILRSQRVRKSNPKYRGGWRYTPDAHDSDLSISVWQLMALRSAKNAGLEVGKEAIRRRYVISSVVTFPARWARHAGEHAERLRLPGQPPEFATAAAGLLSLQVCGEYESPEVKGSTAWLSREEVSTRLQWFTTACTTMLKACKSVSQPWPVRPSR